MALLRSQTRRRTWRTAAWTGKRIIDALEVSLLEMLKAAKDGWGWRREVTLFSEGGEGDNVSKRWRSDIVGFRPEDGKMCVIDVDVITLAAASYRGARRTLRSRCLRTLDEAVKAKLKLPHAAARAKDLNAKHIIFAMSSNGAFSRQARKFFKDSLRVWLARAQLAYCV